MAKPGRNTLCPCGSGKKFKHCCLRQQPNEPQASQSASNEESSVRQQLLASLPAIPDKIQLAVNRDQAEREEFRTNLLQVFDQEKLISLLNWGDRTNQVKTRLLGFGSFRADPFDVQISQVELLLELIKEELISAKDWSFVYWHEIDQYIYSYRSHTVNCLSDRLQAAFRNFDDHITLACVTRQFLEITLSSIANQWVITTCFNRMQRDLDEGITEPCAMMSSSNLEKFVISLTCWSSKQREQLADILDQPSIKRSKDQLTSVDYQPTLRRQLGIVRYIITKLAGVASLTISQLEKDCATMEQYYPYLCKFVHSNVQQLDSQFADSSFDKAQVVRSVQATALQIFDASFFLFTNLFMDSHYDQKRFHKMVPPRLDTSAKQFGEYPDPLFPMVFNNFKDFEVVDPNGERVQIDRVQSHSSRALKFASKFDKLSGEDMQRLEEVATKLRQKNGLRETGAKEQ